MLLLSAGRCEQDDYYLEPITENDLPSAIVRRFDMKIEDIAALPNTSLLVFFKNGMVHKCNLNEYFKNTERFSILSRHPDYFVRVRLQPGGYGIEWDENLMISYRTIYSMGKRIPLTIDDFRSYAAERVINAAEAAEILNCSRQYINELVKNKKLHPVKSSGKNTMFMKSEVLKHSWQ